MKASCKQAALKSCQEEEEEEVEDTVQEDSRRLFLSRGRLWPRLKLTEGGKNSQMMGIHTHVH